jgi:Cof subfamily protein (haloacid dehalogenase superfamily)
MIALDVDGTLLDDSKRVPPQNREALHEARARGVLIAIATGRMTPTVEPIERALEIDCAVIAYNGGKVVGMRSEGRPCLGHHPVDPSVADEVLRFSRENDLLLNFYHDDRLYAEDSPRRRRFMEIYEGRTTSRYQLVDLDRFRGLPPTKLILLADPPERDRLHDVFEKELEGRAHVTRSDPEYLEFMAPGVDKGTALPALAARYGIALEEVMAMGDADNDCLMLRTAGLGIAVANARDCAKAAARMVTERTNNEAAVAEAVERWVL